MKHALATVCLAALFSAAGFSQATFEAADVHVSTDKSPFLYMKGPFMRNGLFDARTASMVDLIGKAYGVENDKILGGPNWLEMDHFDVMAKIPANSTPESRKTMLQALLAERFRLVLHPETKPVPAYALTASKHIMLKSAAAGSGETGCKFDRKAPPAPAPGAPRVPPTFTGTCRNITMAAFAEGMNNMPANFVYIGENRVADRTGLEGAWDFDFKYTQRNPNFSAADTVSLFDALDKQLGLKLEPAEVPMPVLVVDSVNRTPSPNLPNIAEILHVAPVPTEFEVAAVKPTDPDKKGMNFNIKPGGRVDLSGFTLKSLIEEAWDINGNGDDMIAGLAKWMDEDRFDVVAKASTDAVIGSPDGKDLDVDWDSMQLMMRHLLADRFKLAVHMEERSVPAYTLMAAKPKMKKADPASRTQFKEGPASLMAKDPRVANPALSRLVTVQNMTMAQFASKLQSIAPGYIHTPVLDATGLDGAFDFTLNFSPIGLNRAASGRSDEAQPASVTPQASDPNNTGITLPEAIEKQLGLKLVLQKRTVQVLVIDHAEPKPDN